MMTSWSARHWRVFAKDFNVHAYVATEGEKGRSNNDVSQEELAQTRWQEFQTSMALLGIIPHQMSYPDFGIRERYDELVKELVGIFRSLAPVIILAFDKNMRVFLHVDHEYLGRAVEQAWQASDMLDMYPEQGQRVEQRAKLLLFNPEAERATMAVTYNEEGQQRRNEAVAAYESQHLNPKNFDYIAKSAKQQPMRYDGVVIGDPANPFYELWTIINWGLK